MAKRIGILGGMSPESTAAYYEIITRTYTERFGDYGYPEILIYSVSFQSYVVAQCRRWAWWLRDCAGRADIEAAGADSS